MTDVKMGAREYYPLGTIGPALAEATATLDQTDHRELVGALERLPEAAQALADSLRGRV